MRDSSTMQFPIPTRPVLQRRVKLVVQSLLSGMLIGVTMSVCVPTANAGLVYSTAGSTYVQNFDSTGASTSWINDTTLASWSLFRQPAPGTAITTYAAGNGGSNAGSFYSFGSASSERALGGVGSGGAYFGSPGSGAIAGWIAFNAKNDTGQTLTSLNVHYDGEQWRNGGNPSEASQTMVMEYGFGSSFAGVSTWLAAGSTFNFASPVNTLPTAGAVDGNGAGLLANKGGTIAATWNPNSDLWIRFAENNDTGNDHGLALDNFTFSATGVAAVPEPSTFLLGIVGMSAFGARKWRRRVPVPQ